MYHIALVGIYTVRSLYRLHRQLPKKMDFTIYIQNVYFFSGGNLRLQHRHLFLVKKIYPDIYQKQVPVDYKKKPTTFS
jgi:hypothetical protein